MGWHFAAVVRLVCLSDHKSDARLVPCRFKYKRLVERWRPEKEQPLALKVGD